MEKSLAIIMPYFGAVPWYYLYFLHSCKHNPSIHFYVITDNKGFENNCPKNVHIIYLSFSDLKLLLSEKLGLKISFDAPYKLCDFKPSYGIVFSNIISGFEFWGYGDIDVIYGNIRNFITDEILDSYDFINVRHDFLTGYFQLFRNNQKMNTLFMESKDYKKVFSSPQHFCFDETNFAWDAFAEGKPIEEINCEIESMNHVVRKFQDKKQFKAYFDFHVIEGLPGRLKWHNGTLTYKNEFEVMLYHMVLFKKVGKPKMLPKKINDSFRISSTRIYS